MTTNSTFKLDFPKLVQRACRVSGGTLPKDFSVVLPLTMDYSGATGEEIANLAMRSSVIEYQSSARNLAPEFLRKLVKEGVTVHFRNTKFVDPERRVQELMAGGMPEPIAKMAVYEPEKYQKLMAGAMEQLK